MYMEGGFLSVCLPACLYDCLSDCLASWLTVGILWVVKIQTMWLAGQECYVDIRRFGK
jgi:hypothetical protein